MNLFEKMQHAAQYGTHEEYAAANRAWYAEAIKSGTCYDCDGPGPLHPWLGRHEPLCEGCDEVRRLDLDARFDDQRAHERIHVPEVWGF